MFDKSITLEKINQFNKNTLMETLSMECVEIGEDYLVIQMPVDSKVHQPMGLINGLSIIV
jgi:1,4-dihydroxy-2-naphthoyl-CoA hydrolase